MAGIAPTDVEEVAKRFAFHPATRTTGPIHDLLREQFGGLAVELAELPGESREKALALTALQEALMWANAHVAIHLSVPVGQD